MKVSKEAKKGAKALFKASFSAGRLDSGKVSRALGGLLERRPVGVREILHEYQRLVRLEVDNRTAVIESAVSLSENLKAGIQDVLVKGFGDDLKSQFVTSGSLIGGVRIRIGSQVFENSVEDRLRRLRWDISH
jgi:F-type H+-transporting ATPase subunit delta